MKPKKLKPKDSPFLRLLENPKRATGVTITDQKPVYHIVDRVCFNEICLLSLNGDPRFPTVKSVQDEALRLGFVEYV